MYNFYGTSVTIKGTLQMKISYRLLLVEKVLSPVLGQTFFFGGFLRSSILILNFLKPKRGTYLRETASFEHMRTKIHQAV